MGEKSNDLLLFKCSQFTDSAFSSPDQNGVRLLSFKQLNLKQEKKKKKSNFQVKS